MSLSKFVSDHMASLALGGALAVSLYVLAGPASFGTRKRPGGIPGLVNTGNTCFVNSVLQALSACPTFYCWLEDMVLKDKRTGEKVGGHVTRTLLEIVKILNNLSSSVVSDPHNPGRLLSGLRSHGWVINMEEQDAHEMLHVIMTTLEEEVPSKSNNNKPSHASLLDISNLGKDENEESEDDENEEEGDSSYFDNKRFQSLRRGMSLPPESRARDALSQSRDSRDTVSMSRDSSPSGLRQRRRSGVYTKLGEELPSSLVSSFTKTRNQTPFTGLLTSKLSYRNGNKSPVNYSKFDNITLSLPQHGQTVSLNTLLGMFVSQESVEGADSRNNLIKQLSFGKLPECFCFHIQRTGFSGGQAYKRHDYVEFPLELNMERFTHASQAARLRNLHSFMMGADNLSLDNQNKAQYQYSLRAVIVHSGGIHSGHYITYRKGPLGSKSANKWFYTSDSSVRQVHYDEVSKTPAYMLFYEKTSDTDFI